MSVIKWIHVNHGDSILEPFFHKVYNLLSVGGLFVLETQPWESYKKKKLSDEAKKHYETIQIKPELFPELVCQVGFEIVERVETNLNMPPQPGNFQKREIIIFKKSSKE